MMLLRTFVDAPAPHLEYEGRLFTSTLCTDGGTRCLSEGVAWHTRHDRVGMHGDLKQKTNQCGPETAHACDEMRSRRAPDAARQHADGKEATGQ